MDTDTTLRLKTSLATAHSHYDQVVAVSQKIINDSFDGLYDRYPEFKKLAFRNRRIGSIDAELLSPRILLGGGLGADLSLARCLYVMRFASGTLTMPPDDEDDPDIIEDMAGWELAVTIDLGNQSVVVNQDADPDEKARQEAQLKFIQEKFDVPGDYTIERLFAKLSDAHWKDFDFNNSNFGVVDGKKRSWGMLIKQYPFLEIDLQTMLGRWVKTQETQGLTTLGYKFTLPPPSQIDPLKPTYQPTAMYHQIYPYKNPAKGVPNPVVSYDPPGDLNALLYCEMVQGHPLPDDKQLASTGIFTTQAATIGGPRIDGTFALSHQLFLETFLLPMLQPFNKTSEVFPTIPSATFDGNTSTIHWNYSVGSDGVHNDSKDPIFAFKPVFDPQTPSDARSYMFTKDNRMKMSPSPARNPNNGVCGSFESAGSPTVTVKWTPGGRSFDVQGITEYWYDIEWADNEQMIRPFGFLRDKFRFTWNMSIVIDNIDNGVMKIVVNAGANKDGDVKVEFVQHEIQQSWTPEGQDQRIRNFISGQLTTHVAMLEMNLQQAFQSSGKFVYPGNGTFKFSDPCIGNTGEILAEIEYMPIEHGKITIPTPSNVKLASATQFAFKTTPVQAPTVVPTVKLAWEASSPVKAAGKAVEILLTGTNQTEKPIALNSIQIVIVADKTGKGLVTSTRFAPAQFTVGEEERPASTQSNVYQLIHKSVSGFGDVKLMQDAAGGGMTELIFIARGGAELGPGNSVTLALLADTGVAGTYPVQITESWPPVEGLASQSFAHPVDVILKP